LFPKGVVWVSSGLLQPPHLRALKRWPLEEGGGVKGVCNVLTAVCAVVRVPLPPQECIPRDTLVQWQQGNAVFMEGTNM
jgi:hypothetical protein